MTRPGKWIEQAGPETPTGAVAERALRERLREVRHYLPRAAGKPDSAEEAVHQLRIWTRRATAALDTFAGLLSKKRTARLRSKLKRIRRAAGTARDADVLARRLTVDTTHPEAAYWLEQVRVERRAAQRPLKQIHRRLSKTEKLRRRCRQIVKSVRHNGTGGTPFTEWAIGQLRPAVDRLFDAAGDDFGDLEALHAFRIRAKQVRYAMELLVGAFGPEFQDQLYPAVEELQERLGAITDHAAAQATFERWLQESTAPADTVFLNGLIAQEATGLAAERQAFSRWWTTERSGWLRVEFTRCWQRPKKCSGGSVFPRG